MVVGDTLVEECRGLFLIFSTFGGRLVTVWTFSNLRRATAALAVTLLSVPALAATIAPGAAFEFDASKDAGGDATWTNTGAFSGIETLTFVDSQMPTAAAVSDGTLTFLAHRVGADGQSGSYEANLGGAGQAAQRSATFEVWFKPDDLVTANQVIQETGGGGSGTLISLSGANLEFMANGAPASAENAAVSTTLSDTNWHQVVGVINNTADGTANDTLSLYLDGQHVVTSALANINDWAGGNQGGLGSYGGTSHPSGSQIGADDTTSGVDFSGAIHLYRFYTRALTPEEIAGNYAAAQVPEPTALVLLALSVAGGAAGWIRKRI